MKDNRVALSIAGFVGCALDIGWPILKLQAAFQVLGDDRVLMRPVRHIGVCYFALVNRLVLTICRMNLNAVSFEKKVAKPD